jgi:hypothetical protein
MQIPVPFVYGATKLPANAPAVVRLLIVTFL